jgi:predicted nucleic acid-binding protein
VKGYLVDTNIPSELTRDAPDARVAAFLESAGRESAFLSVMTVGEICKGIDMLPVSQKRSALQDWLEIDVRVWFAGRILPVTESIAERWGRHRQQETGRDREAKRVDAGSGGWCPRRHGT